MPRDFDNQAVSNNSNKKNVAARRASILAAFSMAGLALCTITPKRAEADITYNYVGSAFNATDCQAFFSPSSNCVSGKVTGSITFNIPAGYTGTLTGATLNNAITAYSLTANGVGGPFNQPPILPPYGFQHYNHFIGEFFTFSGGSITSWYFGIEEDISFPIHNVLEIETGNPIPSSSAADIAINSYNSAAPSGATNTPGTWFLASAGAPTLLAKALGNPNDLPGGCGCGDPINPVTGNVYEQVVDYQSGGQNKLSFIRSYNSLNNTSYAGTYAKALGRNWRSNYDRYLNVVSSGSVAEIVYAERADGQEITFTSNGSGGYTSDTDVDYTLTQSGSTWTLTDHDGNKETYNVLPSGQGLLTTITLQYGYQQFLAYNGSNQLTTVTDSYTTSTNNRQLSLTYSGNLLNTVTTPGGLVLTYGFDSSGTNGSTLDRLADGLIQHEHRHQPNLPL